jgi:carbon monoxide dehydrogenase subunit G
MLKTTGGVEMASSVHSVEVQTTEQALWSFLKEKGDWAVLIPGYLHHEFESNDEMIWVFKGDFGIIQKAVKLKLTVNNVEENHKIAFELEGLSDNINGDGYFIMEPVNEETFKLTGNLNMSAGGFLAGMINPVLEKFVPETVEQLVNSMGKSVLKETV